MRRRTQQLYLQLLAGAILLASSLLLASVFLNDVPTIPATDFSTREPPVTDSSPWTPELISQISAIRLQGKPVPPPKKEEPELAPPTVAKVKLPSSIELTGILFHREHALATFKPIGNSPAAVCRKGDELQGVTITDITPQEVVLEYRGQQFRKSPGANQ